MKRRNKKPPAGLAWRKLRTKAPRSWARHIVAEAIGLHRIYEFHATKGYRSYRGVKMEAHNV